MPPLIATHITVLGSLQACVLDKIIIHFFSFIYMNRGKQILVSHLKKFLRTEKNGVLTSLGTYYLSSYHHPYPTYYSSQSSSHLIFRPYQLPPPPTSYIPAPSSTRPPLRLFHSSPYLQHILRPLIKSALLYILPPNVRPAYRYPLDTTFTLNTNFLPSTFFSSTC